MTDGLVTDSGVTPPMKGAGDHLKPPQKPGDGWAHLVASWKDGSEALAWAREHGITAEQLGNSGWLRGGSAPEEFRKPLAMLYHAIGNDPRFQTNGKPDFKRFQQFIGLTARFDYGALLASWKCAADALAWAKENGVTPERLGSSNWLNVESKQPPPRGIGRSLSGLYHATKRDLRFQIAGKPDFGKFQEFIGLTVRRDYRASLASWKCRDDVLAWAKENQVTPEQLGSSHWLIRESKEPPPKGIGRSLGGLYFSIEGDSRFQTGGKVDFARFREFIGLDIGVDYAALVASWQSGADALAWAKKNEVTLERLGSSHWLGHTSQQPPPQGIGRSLSGLYLAIRKDPRFQTDRAADFAKFREFIGLEIKVDYAALLKGWKSGADALAWAKKNEVTLERLGSSHWLRDSSQQPPPQGIGRSLRALYLAISKDPRFQTEGNSDFAKFRKFLGLEDRVDFGALLASWKSGDDALAWAKQNGVTPERLGNAHWIERRSQQPPPEGIGRSFSGLYTAISKDPRFQTNGRRDFEKFRSFLGLDSKVDYVALVASWNSGDEALTWGKEYGVTLEQLASASWLQKRSKEPPPEGIGRPLVGLYSAIAKNHRFQTDGAIDFAKFQQFIGVETRVHYSALVANWKTGDDALAWAKENGVTPERLGNAGWLKDGAQQPPPGGIETSLATLYKAIVRDTRFRTDGKADFTKFRLFLGFNSEVVYADLLASWKSREDALAWATENGVSLERLGSSTWLQKRSKQPPPEGIGISLWGLFDAIVKDIRFQSDGIADFEKFRKFLGLEASLSFSDIVNGWRTPEDVHRWARMEGISPAQLSDYKWLRKNARRSHEEGGVAKTLNSLYSALLERFGSLSNFEVWLSGQDSRTQAEILRELFSSPEAHALRGLAEKLGEAALAEYLVATSPDKFSDYGMELIENLRSYLGELEQTPRATTEDDLPERVFMVDKLAHLRQALFNWYRDSYQPLYARGLTVVTEELESKRAQAKSEYHQAFYSSLIEYFSTVDELTHPSRLKTSLHRDQEFPAAHQKMAMFEVGCEKRILLADEMGGGKTGSAVGSFELLRETGVAKRALIICPAKVVPVWRAALQNGETGYFRPGASPDVAFMDSKGKDWNAARTADYTVISLEMIRGETGGVPNVKLLQDIDYDFLIFDEAHNAKSLNVDSSDTERVFSISQSPTLSTGHTMLLSGTPIPNTVEDLAAQLRLLYAGTKADMNLEVHDLQALSRTIVNSHPLMVRNLLVRKMIRRKTEDCLPVGCEYHREQVSTDLNPVSRAIYSTIVDDPLLSATEKIGALRRCTLDAKFETVSAAIDKALADPKYAAANRQPKIVIAESAFASGVTRDAEDRRPAEPPGQETYLYSRLQNEYGAGLKVFVLDGTNSRDREGVLKAFHDYPHPACLLTLVSVSGEGLNITCAADGILISPTYTVSSEEQFIRRMLRAGQQLPVRLQVLTFSDTIEEGIANYSARKHRAVGAVIDGRPLTAMERAILEDDFSSVKKNGPIAYESLTPRQQALWILRKLKGLGKEGIQKLLYADDGRYAKDFARGYPADEQTSTSGNTARLVAAVIDRLRGSGSYVVADIACGCRTLERMFEGSRDITVKSVDINEVALSAGAELMSSPVETQADEIRTMDDLPFANDSIDIGVVSLALDMTQHSRSRGAAGQERVRALLELNRTLKEGGNAVITLQESLFESLDDFSRFVGAIEERFGFTRDVQFTGLATAYNAADSGKYAVWMIVLNKTTTVSEVDLQSDALWRDLRFPRVARDIPEARRGPAQPAQNKSGAYQDTFIIGGQSLSFSPSTMRQCEVIAEAAREQREQLRLGARVEALITTYHSIAEIPPEMLLSITPDEVDRATQQERDSYYRVLIERFGSEDRIPKDMIESQNSHILVRRVKKTKEGDRAYLCLAKISKDRKSWGGCGTRYFYD